MIKKTLLLLGALLALWLGGRALYVALASPQKKIRWRLEEMVEGFNETRMRPVLGGIAADFVDRTSEITREDLQRTLAWMFLNETGEQGEFLWRAELDRDALAIAVAEGARSASVECRVLIFRDFGKRPVGPPDKNAVPEWDARLAGTMALTDDGWQWTELLRANHSERRRR